MAHGRVADCILCFRADPLVFNGADRAHERVTDCILSFWCKKMSVVCFGERPFRAETQEVVHVNDNAVFTYLWLFLLVLPPDRTIFVEIVCRVTIRRR